ncbi:hypothetical protein BOX15_Mlig009223g1 [Macrostomum lignano]|uniref:Na_H_Exchanger domain-containing protein n=2 Tax=Macrostomum lignano TaxID=282301 RepID=A0A267ECR3_9PLAT|nr:hypothetical protein BOX15_Mlig009223g1 [Macrostomum lignano]
MGETEHHSKSYAFMFTHHEDIQTTIVVIFLFLVWGIVYMSIINNRLYVFFNETVCNSLIGMTFGLLFGTSRSLKSLAQFFLPWNNFDNNILPFLIMYPASKLCVQSTRKQLRMTITFAILKTALCVLLIVGSVIAYVVTQSNGYLSTKSTKFDFHQVMYALYIGSSLAMVDSYLCVHNFPEIRGNCQMRGFLSSYGLVSMSYALELRQIAVDLSNDTNLSIGSTSVAVLKRALFVPMVSVMLGLTAGLLSSYVTKHSSFLHVQQEMVVLPCSNYISYTVAQKMGLSPIIASISCELIQSTFCIHNMSEASKISYKSMLAKTSKLLGFFGSLSIGFVFGSVENRFLWKYVSWKLVLLFLAVSILSRILSTMVAYFLVKRLGFKMHSNMMFLQLLIHTRSLPAFLSLINMQEHSSAFHVCLSYLLCMQWSLYFMCNAVNVVNVPLVGLVYKRLGIKQDLVDGQVEPIFHVIFRLMYHEMDSQIAYLSGRQRRCEFASLLSSHMQSSFLRYVMSLGFMSVPERRSPILSAYDETISQRSNVIDQRRRSLKSRHQIYATQVCARFIVKNLCFEGFHPDDIVEYFFTGGSTKTD